MIKQPSWCSKAIRTLQNANKGPTRCNASPLKYEPLVTVPLWSLSLALCLHHLNIINLKIIIPYNTEATNHKNDTLAVLTTRPFLFYYHNLYFHFRWIFECFTLEIKQWYNSSTESSWDSSTMTWNSGFSIKNQLVQCHRETEDEPITAVSETYTAIKLCSRIRVI